MNFFNRCKRHLLIALLAIISISIFSSSNWKLVLNESIHYVRVKLIHEPKLLVNRLLNPLPDSCNLEIRIPKDEAEKLESYKVYEKAIKKYVKGSIVLDGKTYKCEFKLHGSMPSHRTGLQTSYKIKLDPTGPFMDGKQVFQLIKLPDGNPIILAANKIAHMNGLISSYGRMVNVTENNVNKGVYYLTEDIGKPLLEREFGITNFAEIVNTNDWSRAEGYSHTSDLSLYHGHIENDKGTQFKLALFEFKKLSEAVKRGDVNEVSAYFDDEYISKFLAVTTLFNDVHFMTGDNLRLIYNFDNGKFYPVFRIETKGFKIPDNAIDPTKTPKVSVFNDILFESAWNGYSDAETNLIFKSLISNPKIRHGRDSILYSFCLNQNFWMTALRDAHTQNLPTMYRSSFTQYVKSCTEQSDQEYIVESIFKLTNRYLKYCHIYGSHDKSAGNLNLMVDSYVPITIIDTVRNIVLSQNFVGIGIDKDLKSIRNPWIIDSLPDSFNSKHLIFINEVTGDTVKSDKVYINKISSKGYSKVQRSNLDALEKHKVKFNVVGDTLIILSGNYFFTGNTILNEFNSVRIENGSQFSFKRNSSLRVEANTIEVRGKENSPIKFFSTVDSLPFGNISLVGTGQNPAIRIDYTIVENGSVSQWGGHQTTGQFSVFSANTSISNSVFKKSRGDDGLNLKFCKAQISNCVFENNNADQVDLDFCIAKVNNCTFRPSGIDANGDGLDFSGGYARVSNCNFEGFADKGISVGERSLVFIEKCEFIKNAKGICIKDGSNAYSVDNHFKENERAYDGYIKKQIFSKPSAFVASKEEVDSSLKEHCNINFMASDSIQAKIELFEFNYAKFTPKPGVSHKQKIDSLILPLLK